MENMIGRTVGQYQITEIAGKGGMAIVYKAYQASLQRYVALKVLPEYMAQDEQFVMRFRQEALAAAALRHPNIMVIYDVGKEGYFYYIATEFLEGKTLSQVISQQRGPLHLPRIVNIINQIASALDFAHQRGVVHRDIKPSNILVAPDDHATLMDFGIAKALMSSGQMTRTGTMVGTPEYMSPEQAEARQIDHRSDIYSLGIVLYEMLTGRVPFMADAPTAILLAHTVQPPIPPTRLNSSIPPAVEAVVLRALAKRPDERFASAGEMAQALTQAALGLGGADQLAPTAIVRPSPTPPPGYAPATPLPAQTPPPVVQKPLPPPPIVRPRGKSRWLLWGGLGGAAVALLCLAGLVLTYMLAMQPSSSKPKIAFVSDRDGNAEIYLMNPDGSELVNLTNRVSNDYYPHWSPDKKKIAFHSYEPNEQTSDIYVMDADGQNWVRLTRNEAANKFPVWSPNGKQFVFATDRDGNYEIYTMNSDGSGAVRLTDNPAKDYFPAWSPDGRSIVFESERDGNSEIYIMDADRENIINLTNHPAKDVQATWSPDGSMIAFTSDRSGQSEVWVMSKDGSNPIQLTTDGGEQPNWSTDGSKIVFASKRDGNLEIYIMNKDGSAQTRLTNSPSSDWDACWSK